MKTARQCKIRSVRNTYDNEFNFESSTLSSCFGFKKNSNAKITDKRPYSPPFSPQTKNPISDFHKRSKKDAKEFIDDLSELRMCSTNLFAYLDNEHFKVKQLKDLQFHSIEQAAKEIIDSVIELKDHIISNLESEYNDLIGFLKKAQCQFNKGISIFDTTLKTIHPNDKLTKYELLALEKKLINLQLTENRPSQIAVINIKENSNFRSQVEKIINSSFTLDNIEIESSNFELFNTNIQRICDKLNATAKELSLQS